MIEIVAIAKLMIEENKEDEKRVSLYINNMLKKINGKYIVPKDDFKTLIGERYMNHEKL